MLRSASCDDVKALAEVCLNIVRGNIPLSPALFGQLKKHKRIIRHIACKKKHKNPMQLKRYVSHEVGGFIPSLPLLLTGLTSVLGGVAGRAISKASGL